MTPPVRAEALGRILHDAEELARAAYGRPIDVDWKGDGSPVTAVDRAIDALLHDALGALVPGAGWLSEESADDRSRLERELVWIVDPIDGTKQLVRRIPEIAISIALVRDGSPVAAAVANPIAGERGVWVEGSSPRFEGLTPREAPDDLDAAEAIVSRSESEEGELVGLGGLVGSTRAVGSVAYKLLRVASRADALTFSVRPKSEWDVCGGIALVLAAGGAFVRLDGRPVVFNQPDPSIPSGGVAGPPALARALADRLRAAGRAPIK